MKIKDWIKGKKRKRWINGTRGAIALLMAFIMTPILSISLLLVESARYQSAVESLEELMSLAGFSTISNYDAYLDERFGLLAMDTTMDAEAVYKSYIEENAKAISSDIVLQDVVVDLNDEYTLGSTDILKQQLLEYSELSVPIQMTAKALDLKQLLKDLVKKMNLDGLTGKVDKGKAAVDVAKEIEKIAESLKELYEIYDPYIKSRDAYKNSYTTFEARAKDLITALKDAEAEIESAADDEDSTTPSSPYEFDSVKKALKDFKSARDTYKSNAEKLQKNLETVIKSAKNFGDALSALPTKLEKLRKAVNGSDGGDETYQWIIGIAEMVLKEYKDIVNGTYVDLANEELNALKQQITDLKNISDTTITSSWTTNDVYSKYGPLDVDTFDEEFGKRVYQTINDILDATKVTDKGMMGLGDLIKAAKAITDLDVLYNPALNAKVDSSRMYAAVGMKLSDTALMASIEALLSAAEDFKSALTSGGIIGKIVKIAKAVVKFIAAMVAFIGAILAWVIDIFVNIVHATGDLFSGEALNTFILYGYGMYDMPNRLTYYDKSTALFGTTLSGYSYQKIYDSAGGKYSMGEMFGSIADLSSLSQSGGSDKMFKGACSEYLLVGSASETFNQASAFFNIFLLRFLLDYIPTSKDPAITSLSAAAGPAAIAVTIIAVLIEALLTTFVIVNNGKVPVYKNEIYLSPTGMAVLGQQLVDVSGFSTKIKGTLGNVIKEKTGTGGKELKGVVSVKYTEYLMLLMYLSTNQETYLKRVQNIIQLEGKVAAGDDFTLDKCYVFVSGEIEYDLQKWFNFDSISDSDLKGKHLNLATGY